MTDIKEKLKNIKIDNLYIISDFDHTRDFDSFKATKSYKPLKNGCFFVKFCFLILRNSW